MSQLIEFDLIKSVFLAIWFLTTGCATTQLWELNDGIPQRAEMPERIRFEERMNRLLKIHSASGNPRDWYVVNGKSLVIKIPPFHKKKIEKQLPHVACNPKADMRDCRKIDK